MSVCVAVSLVGCKCPENDNCQRVGPQFVAPQGNHDQHFCESVRKEKHGGKQRIGRRELLREMREVRSEKVVWITRKFMLQEPQNNLIQLRRADEPEQKPADGFENAVNPFQGDAGLKRPVEQGGSLHGRQSITAAPFTRSFFKSLSARFVSRSG